MLIDKVTVLNWSNMRCLLGLFLNDMLDLGFLKSVGRLFRNFCLVIEKVLQFYVFKVYSFDSSCESIIGFTLKINVPFPAM